MKKVNKDLVIGIVGTLILVTAMVGVFRYEAAQASGAVFDVTWTTATAPGTASSGTTQEGESSSGGVDLDRRNVTKVEFVLEWTDDLGDPDEFNLTITSPDGVARSATASNGRVAVTFDTLAQVPNQVRESGRDEADVTGAVSRKYGSDTAIGRWTFAVTLVSAGDQTVPVLGGPAVQQDAANAWMLTPQLTYYEARLAGI